MTRGNDLISIKKIYNNINTNNINNNVTCDPESMPSMPARGSESRGAEEERMRGGKGRGEDRGKTKRAGERTRERVLEPPPLPLPLIHRAGG